MRGARCRTATTPRSRPAKSSPSDDGARFTLRGQPSRAMAWTLNRAQVGGAGRGQCAPPAAAAVPPALEPGAGHRSWIRSGTSRCTSPRGVDERKRDDARRASASAKNSRLRHCRFALAGMDVVALAAHHLDGEGAAQFGARQRLVGRAITSARPSPWWSSAAPSATDTPEPSASARRASPRQASAPSPARRPARPRRHSAEVGAVDADPGHSPARARRESTTAPATRARDSPPRVPARGSRRRDRAGAAAVSRTAPFRLSRYSVAGWSQESAAGCARPVRQGPRCAWRGAAYDLGHLHVHRRVTDDRPSCSSPGESSLDAAGSGLPQSARRAGTRACSSAPARASWAGTSAALPAARRWHRAPPSSARRQASPARAGPAAQRSSPRSASISAWPSATVDSPAAGPDRRCAEPGRRAEGCRRPSSTKARHAGQRLADPLLAAAAHSA